MKMILDQWNVLYELCRATGKFGLMIQFTLEGLTYDEAYDEILKATGDLLRTGMEDEPDYQILGDGLGYFLFDTKEEMERAYNQVVGDDGPTELNPYDGPARVYAGTVDNHGRGLTENT